MNKTATDNLRKIDARVDVGERETIDTACRLWMGLRGTTGAITPELRGEFVATIAADWLDDTSNAIRERREEG